MGQAPSAPAAVVLPHPYDPQEVPLSSRQKLVLYACSPIIFALAIVRAILFILCIASMGIVCALALIGSPPGFNPLLGMRRYIVRTAAYVFGRLILLSFGVWPTLLTVNGEWDKTTPLIVMAPHVGMTDAFVGFILELPRPLILEPYSKMPCARQILQACGALLVPVASAGSKAAADKDKSKGTSSQTNAVREAILEHKRNFLPGDTPIALFTEGITHAGTALLPFFPGAFEGGTAVQPLVVRYGHKYYNGHAFLSDLGTHLVRLFAVRAAAHSAAARERCACCICCISYARLPMRNAIDWNYRLSHKAVATHDAGTSLRKAAPSHYTRRLGTRCLGAHARLGQRTLPCLSAMARSHVCVHVSPQQSPWLTVTVDYLPAHHPTSAEATSGPLMAEAVRAEMSAASGLPMHTLGARELRKEMKAAAELKHAKKAAAGEAPKALV